MEIIKHFESFDAFNAWQINHRIDASDVDTSIENILKNGISSLLFGDLDSSDITIKGKNYREQLFAGGLNSRQRGILELLYMYHKSTLNKKTKIYAPEAVTEFALKLRSIFPYFIGSEYAQSDAQRRDIYPLPNEDLSNLSFISETFDAVLTCDVLEHVANLSDALKEIFRVLKYDGVSISSHPFTWKQRGIKKAELINGQVNYLVEPEYHGNPIDSKGSLVFEIPGWDILELCRSIGFRSAETVVVYSERMGIIGDSPPYINFLYLKK